MLLAIQLVHDIFNQILVLLELEKDVLGDLCLLLCSGTTKEVEANVEPFVDIPMQDMVFVAQLLGCAFLLECLGLSCCAILISSADIESIVIPSLVISSPLPLAYDRSVHIWLEKKIPCENICTQHTAYYVPQMGHIIDIRQCRSDEDIPVSLFWQAIRSAVS